MISISGVSWPTFWLKENANFTNHNNSFTHGKTEIFDFCPADG